MQDQHENKIDKVGISVDARYVALAWVLEVAKYVCGEERQHTVFQKTAMVFDKIFSKGKDIEELKPYLNEKTFQLVAVVAFHLVIKEILGLDQNDEVPSGQKLYAQCKAFPVDAYVSLQEKLMGLLEKLEINAHALISPADRLDNMLKSGLVNEVEGIKVFAMELLNSSFLFEIKDDSTLLAVGALAAARKCVLGKSFEQTWKEVQSMVTGSENDFNQYSNNMLTMAENIKKLVTNSAAQNDVGSQEDNSANNFKMC